MSHGLTAEKTVRVIGELHWATSRLFALLGEWSSEADRPDIAVSMATSSRHLGWHVADLAELQPESVLLADESVSDPRRPDVEAALEAIRMTTGSVGRLAVVHRVLLPRLAARCTAIERVAAAPSDAALLRVIRFLLSDLRNDRDDGDALLGILLADLLVVEEAHGCVLDAESRLVAAGGLLPIGFED